jgi:hypothetical protein
MSLRSLRTVDSWIRFLSFTQRIQLPVANGGFRPMGNITTVLN